LKNTGREAVAMVRSRKILAYLLTFTLLALGLPTANAAEETLVGQQATAKASGASLTVRIDSPNSKFDPARQYTLPRSGLTLLPSVESKYASGSDLFNLYKSDGLYSYAPVAGKPGLGRLHRFNSLELGFAAASPRSMFPQDTTQAPQQPPKRPMTKVGKALIILGAGSVAGGAAMMAHGNEGCVGTCIDWRSTGAVWAGAGAVLLVIGLVKLRQ
jgi:hypothetical protein